MKTLLQVFAAPENFFTFAQNLRKDCVERGEKGATGAKEMINTKTNPMTRIRTINILIVLVTALGFGPTRAWSDNGDDFEDGAINSLLWEWGGSRRGVDGFGSGSWQWSHEEITGSDGYLQLRVWGPTSANTFGADAWIRTKFNFNDGSDHVINFRWSASVIDSHINLFAVQITDGQVPVDNDLG